jgi:hypothetical protein
MEALESGARFVSESFKGTVTPASNAVVKAQRLTTYCHGWQAGATTTGIFNAYAQNAIIRKGGGFLVAHRHP